MNVDAIIEEIDKLSIDELEAAFKSFGLDVIRKSVGILEKLYNIKDHTEALSYIFMIIEEEFSNHSLGLVDDILYFLEPSKCEVIISTGILRCCSRYSSIFNLSRI
jgi:hypothetical protein